jgi:hypothetical protein
LGSVSGVKYGKARYRIGDDASFLRPSSRRRQYNSAPFNAGVERIAGADTESPPQRSREHDLPFSRNSGSHR